MKAPPTPRPASLPLQALRYGRLIVHLLRGALTVILVFGWASPARRRTLRQAWSARLLAILGLKLEVSGEPLAPGSLLVANHISWVDVFAINAVAPAAFVSKAEVRRWPLIGWLAARNETVFLRRGSRGHARIVNGEIARILADGGLVAVFPEGTTSDGSHVLHFHGALLQAALDTSHGVQPAALSYRDQMGQRALAPAYTGDTTLKQCLAAIVRSQGLVARITIHPTIPASPQSDRKRISRQAREVIAGDIARPPF
ncbi:MAG: lysophospholipid acyltransferase family protein [Rhodocyclaceae bacterium]|nr:lysophospholipid acyltransferase family protein [Rhodocyclaceae bacterium]